MKNFALIISIIFHPLLMATYLCLLLFFVINNTAIFYLTPFEVKWRISLVVFLFSFIFPVLNIFILVKLKRIPSITLSERRDRTFPFLLVALFYFGLFYLIMDLNIWNSIKLFIFGGAISILACLIINLRFKISIHMVGIGGFLGVLFSLAYLINIDLTPYYIVTTIIAGMVGFARLFLNEHKPIQIYLGFFLGVIIQTGLFFGLQKITFI